MSFLVTLMEIHRFSVSLEAHKNFFLVLLRAIYDFHTIKSLRLRRWETMRMKRIAALVKKKKKDLKDTFLYTLKRSFRGGAYQFSSTPFVGLLMLGYPSMLIHNQIQTRTFLWHHFCNKFILFFPLGSLNCVMKCYVRSLGFAH